MHKTRPKVLPGHLGQKKKALRGVDQAKHMGGIFFALEHRPPESQNHNSEIWTLPRLAL